MHLHKTLWVYIILSWGMQCKLWLNYVTIINPLCNFEMLSMWGCMCFWLHLISKPLSKSLAVICCHYVWVMSTITYYVHYVHYVHYVPQQPWAHFQKTMYIMWIYVKIMYILHTLHNLLWILRENPVGIQNIQHSS